MLDKNGLFLVIWCRLVPEQVRLLKRVKEKLCVIRDENATLKAENCF